MKAFSIFLLLALTSPVLADQNAVPFHATIDTQPVPIGSCGPTCAILSIPGDGQGLHMGRLEMEGQTQIDFVTLVQTGSSVLTAADGSSLSMEFEGAFVPGPTPADATFSGSWNTVSGTGRFEGVSGGGTYDGSADASGGLLHLDGTLSHPGRR